MSENQKELINQYFQSLVNQFITDPDHKDITIVFKSSLGGSLHGDTLGNTHRDHAWKDQETSPGSGIYKKVSGSDVYKYTISFLNSYKDTDQLRGTVVHEFTHLYFFSKSDASHDHDNTFYSEMDRFENWLDRYYGLSPRKDKGGDWNQHVDYDKRKQRENQYPSQSKNNEDDYSPSPRYRDTPEGKERAEWSHLISLIRDAKTLTELERNWQTVKNSSLYDSNKKTWDYKNRNNKEDLDKYYNTYKEGFCTSCLNDKKNHQSNCGNKCSKCSHSRLRNDSEKCHNKNCENSCDNPKWDREREERDKSNKRREFEKEENDTKKETGRSNRNEQKEFNCLVKSFRNSQNLTELEQIWQEIKNSSLYSSSKHNWKNKELDNKAGLDNEYDKLKDKLSSNTENESNYPKSTEPTGISKSRNEGWMFALVIGSVILGIYLFFKLLTRPARRRKKKPKK